MKKTNKVNRNPLTKVVARQANLSGIIGIVDGWFNMVGKERNKALRHNDEPERFEDAGYLTASAEWFLRGFLESNSHSVGVSDGDIFMIAEVMADTFINA